MDGRREAEEQFRASIRDVAIRLRPYCPGLTDEEFERLVCKAVLVQVRHTMPSALFESLRERAPTMCPDVVRDALANLPPSQSGSQPLA